MLLEETRDLAVGDVQFQIGALGIQQIHGEIVAPAVLLQGDDVIFCKLAGTLIGGVAGNILPGMVTASLGVAIYAMLIAIVVPETRKRSCTALCVCLAVFLSCVFKFMPMLTNVPQGFVIIICAVTASVIFAIFAPVPQVESEDV